MQPPPTDQGSARLVALAASVAAAAALLYMGALCASDWLAARILAGVSAQASASRLCARLPGCDHASIGPGFDWRHARRTVVVRVKESLHAELPRQRVLEEIGALAAHAPGLSLRWALRAEPRVLFGHIGADPRGDRDLPSKARP